MEEEKLFLVWDKSIMCQPLGRYVLTYIILLDF